jgi:hypothetical protein
MVRLATGQQMATFLKSKGVNLTKLTNAQIRDGNNGADLGALTQAQRAALLRRRRSGSTSCARPSPTTGSSKGSGPVSWPRPSTVPWRAASLDRRDPIWQATLGPDSSTFRTVDLLLFAGVDTHRPVEFTARIRSQLSPPWRLESRSADPWAPSRGYLRAGKRPSRSLVCRRQ